LTESGRNLKLSNANALKLFQEIHQTFSVERRKQRDKSSKSDTSDISDEIPDEETDHRSILLKKIMSVSPEGFERLCQRLLRESGFESVTVTGRSGDGGLDGIGVLQVNAFVSSIRIGLTSSSIWATTTPDFEILNPR
jgi:restriction system protein